MQFSNPHPKKSNKNIGSDGYAAVSLIDSLREINIEKISFCFLNLFLQETKKMELLYEKYASARKIKKRTCSISFSPIYVFWKDITVYQNILDIY